LYRGLRLDQARIRLVGVKAEGFRGATEVARQLTLDDVTDAPLSPAATRADEAADAARARFGPAAVRRAALMGGPDRRGEPARAIGNDRL